MKALHQHRFRLLEQILEGDDLARQVPAPALRFQHMGDPELQAPQQIGALGSLKRTRRFQRVSDRQKHREAHSIRLKQRSQALGQHAQPGILDHWMREPSATLLPLADQAAPPHRSRSAISRMLTSCDPCKGRVQVEAGASVEWRPVQELSISLCHAMPCLEDANS